MKPGTLLRLAAAGSRTDLVRIVLTASGAVMAVFALLGAATVLSIPTRFDQTGAPLLAPYTNQLLSEPGLRAGLAMTLIMLTVPVLLFVGQCARLGAPARDRRLAAMRLAGATPAQIRALAVTESGLAAVVGSGVGLVAFLVARRVWDAPNADGLRPLPTDVLPPSAVLAVVTLGLPLLSAAATAILLARVGSSPFGVVRRVRRGSPQPWPGLLIGVGVAVFTAFLPVQRQLAQHDVTVPGRISSIVLFLAALSCAIGVALGAGWIAFTLGRLLARFGRGPAALIAGRRLQADPWSGSRALSAFLAAILVGAGIAWVTGWFRTYLDVRQRSQHELNLAMGQPDFIDANDGFYLRTMQLLGYAALAAGLIGAAGLMVALANSIVERRRAWASLTASGVPRSVLARAVLWQTIGVAVPAVLLALATGVVLGRGVTSPTAVSDAGTVGLCKPPPQQPDVCESGDPALIDAYTTVIEVPTIVGRVGIPWSELGVISGWAAGAVVLTAGLGMIFLRASTAPEELRTT